MSFTYLQEKDATANVLGNTDGATADTVRDNGINYVRQNEIANSYPYSWSEASTTLAISSGTASLATDHNITHKPKDVRVVNTGTGNDYIYHQVRQEAFDFYGSGDYVYFIDWDTSAKRWRMNTPSDVSLRVIYFATPATLTLDADVDNIPDLDAIAFLSAARFYLATDGDETNHDRFKALGKERIRQMILNDKRSRPQRLSRGTMYGSNLGWNHGN